MPQAFDNCVKSGGKVRTKKLSGGKYMHICFPKDGGPSIAGEVKSKSLTQSGSPEGRKYERKQ